MGPSPSLPISMASSVRPRRLLPKRQLPRRPLPRKLLPNPRKMPAMAARAVSLRRVVRSNLTVTMMSTLEVTMTRPPLPSHPRRATALLTMRPTKMTTTRSKVRILPRTTMTIVPPPRRISLQPMKVAREVLMTLSLMTTRSMDSPWPMMMTTMVMMAAIFNPTAVAVVLLTTSPRCSLPLHRRPLPSRRPPPASSAGITLAPSRSAMMDPTTRSISTLSMVPSVVPSPSLTTSTSSLAVSVKMAVSLPPTSPTMISMVPMIWTTWWTASTCLTPPSAS
mmetsp:Transcript_15565/g.45024  ORF Transcript_15565/g.45024 Transcript_15565/m.45024 type:complete len:279 (+) Transcript_15565:120-956(+)